MTGKSSIAVTGTRFTLSGGSDAEEAAEEAAEPAVKEAAEAAETADKASKKPRPVNGVPRHVR
ncbi:hypothetical protein [Streptomyces sp. MST-110588]|uniref:hypothetical protein n=1 Tax=Streptomyces sp. MST-110588 TaxID=2833628 RepID=UPI001F5D8453|nr:hypothetical protein [Streptomyces sp. MST-110588]UNO41624.1 hypothetical protein KGS77_21330 [Streptomyces sp. MST-110588]